MASSRPFEPVLHCRKDRPNHVYQLASSLLNGLYKHPDDFPYPKVPQTVMEEAKTELLGLISDSEGDTKMMKRRNAKAIEIHGYCNELLDYVRPICKGDPVLIGKSGFPNNRQPSKHPVPSQPQIIKIVKAPGDKGYKVILQKMNTAEMDEKDPQTHLRGVLFTVELTLTPDDPDSWKDVCKSAPRDKLFFRNVFPGSKNHVRVYGINSAGMGERSLSKYFTPEHP